MSDSTFLPDLPSDSHHDDALDPFASADNEKLLDLRLRRFGRMARVELAINTVLVMAVLIGAHFFLPLPFAAFMTLSLLTYLMVSSTLTAPVGQQLIQEKQYDTAERLFTANLWLSRKCGIFGWCAMIGSMDMLRHLFFVQARHAEGELLIKRWIAIEDPGQLRGSRLLRNNLACIYAEGKRLKEASSLINPKEADGDRLSYRPWRVVLRANLGYAYLLAGKYEAARILLTEALELHKSKAGKVKTELGSNILNNLGLCNVNLEKFEEAERLLEESLNLRKQILKPNHVSFAYSYHNFGRLYYAQRRYEEAELQFSSALSIREMNLPADHPDIATTLECYALTLNRLGKGERAAEALKRAEEIRQTHALTEQMRKGTDVRLLPPP